MSKTDYINIDKFSSWYSDKRTYDETAMFVSPEYARTILFQNEFVHEVSELIATLRLRHQADVKEVMTDIKVVQPIALNGLTHEQQVHAVFEGLVSLNEKLLDALSKNGVRSPHKHISQMFLPSPINEDSVSFHLQTRSR